MVESHCKGVTAAKDEVINESAYIKMVPYRLHARKLPDCDKRSKGHELRSIRCQCNPPAHLDKIHILECKPGFSAQMRVKYESRLLTRFFWSETLQSGGHDEPQTRQDAKIRCDPRSPKADPASLASPRWLEPLMLLS